MWVSTLEVHGIAGCEDPRALERIDTLTRPFMDALLLFCMGADSQRLDSGAHRLGWRARSSKGELRLKRPHAVARMLSEQANSTIRVTLTLKPDPPLYGRLRKAVLRNPSLALGLGDGTFSARIAWLFTADLQHARTDLDGARLGEVDLPLGESPWVVPLLQDVSRRIRVVGWGPIQPVTDRLAEALNSPEPALRARALQALADLEQVFDLPIHILRDARGGRVDLGVGPALRPLRWAGPDAERVLRTVVEAMVVAPDVLVLPWAPDERARSWLKEKCEGENAVLEQVLVAP